MQERTHQEIRDSLTKEIDRLSFIYNGLSDYAPYREALKSFKLTIENLDASWQFLYDPAKWNEARISKMAALSVVNYLDHIKYDLECKQKEISILDNPDEVVSKYYDER